MLLFSATLWKLIPHLHAVSPNCISASSTVFCFMCAYFHHRCIYSEGLRPVLLLCAEGHSGFKSGELNWKDLQLQCGAVLLLHKHIFSFWKWQAPRRFDEFAFQSPAPHFTFTFFFLSRFLFCLCFPLGLLLHSKGHNHVTSMFKTKCARVSESTAVWGQVNLDFKMWH